jgi:hypothetical protein
MVSLCKVKMNVSRKGHICDLLQGPKVVPSSVLFNFHAQFFFQPHCSVINSDCIEPNAEIILYYINILHIPFKFNSMFSKYSGHVTALFNCFAVHTVTV